MTTPGRSAGGAHRNGENAAREGKATPANPTGLPGVISVNRPVGGGQVIDGEVVDLVDLDGLADPVDLDDLDGGGVGADPGQARTHIDTHAREAGEPLATRLVLAAAQPARGGRWAGRAEVSAAVDRLRAELARLGRSRDAAARQTGAEIATAAVELLAKLTARAARVDAGRRTPTAEESRARLDEYLAARAEVEQRM